MSDHEFEIWLLWGEIRRSLPKPWTRDQVRMDLLWWWAHPVDEMPKKIALEWGWSAPLAAREIKEWGDAPRATVPPGWAR